MTPILDAIRLALSSIWANKLRSFMMVLGNIVAVTSIIAVVSLIQGMNAYVGDAIVKDVGLGTFNGLLSPSACRERYASEGQPASRTKSAMRCRCQPW